MSLLPIQRPVADSSLTYSYEQLKDPSSDSDIDDFALENLKDRVLKNKPQFMQNITKLNAHALSNLCNALHDLSIEDQDLFDVIAGAALEKMGDFNARDLVNVARVFDAREDFSTELFDRLQEETLKKCSTFDEWQLCAIIDIFSEYDGVEGFLKKIAPHLVENVEKYSAKHISNLSQSFSKAMVRHEKLFEKISNAARVNLETFQFREMATLIHSWTILDISINRIFFKRVQFLLSQQRRMNHWSFSRAFSMLVRACAKKQHYGLNLLLLLRNRLTVHARRLNPEELAWSVWGFATLELREMHPLLVNMSKRMCKIAQECEQNQLGAIAYGFAKANFADEKLFQCISTATLSKLDTFIPLHLYTIVTAFSCNKVHDRLLFEKIAEKILSMKNQFGKKQYDHILDCYASLGYEDLLNI